MTRVGPVIAMHRANRPIPEIAAAAEVDGEATAAALETLALAAARSMTSERTDLDSKSLILLDFRRILGLEGLVQNVDRFLIGRNPTALRAVNDDLAAAKEAIGRYARHNPTSDEAKALEDLALAVDKVEARVAEGATLPGVLDTRALQGSLGRLEAAVYAEAMTAQNNLQLTLGQVSDRAGTIIVLVSIGAILLIAGSVWLLAFRIGQRIKAVTRAMRELANGRLDAEIPAAGDRDEIGEMSQALLVFRDGLRANATMTQELAESSRLASLGAMVAGMAHELNTPLGNALAVSSTLEEQCKAFRKDLNSERILRSVLDRHAASLADAAALIQRNIVRASEQIGSFKQVAVDQTSGRRREFHLDDVLANVVQTSMPMFKRSPYTLTLGEPSGAVMDSYPGALSQVVTNLIENGMKHGLAGRAAGKVEVSVRRLGPQFTEIVVSDDGAGIPEEIKPSIFHAFFTTKAGKGGSGLGLHIVKSIVCGPLGGQISVQCEPGRGSRFILTLPNKAPAETVGIETTERTYYAAAQTAA
jgi:signal transduction histidine kinase